MKKLIMILITLITTSCSQPKVCKNIEVLDDGLVYQNEKLYTGSCAYYDDNNGEMISSHEYNNGKFHGKWKFYYPNGQLETSGRFNNGLRIGKWNYYYENGKKSQLSFYSNGKKDGIWKVYNQEGNFTVAQEWKDGIAVIDTTESESKDFDIKMDGFKVTPLKVKPDTD